VAGTKKTKNLIAARRSKIFARRMWTALKVILVLASFAAALWGLNYFYNSSYFRIKTIDINGNTHYEDESIMELLPGIEGKNIFEADKKETEDVILEKLVWVRSAEFKKIFPDTIEINLAERKPLLILLRGDIRYLLDGEGIVLEDLGRKTPQEYRDLLEVRDTQGYSLEPGDVAAKKNVLSCAEIYAGFDDDLKAIIKSAGIRNNVSGDIYFTTSQGLEIIFGDSTQAIKKIEVLKLLLKEERIYNIIDLKSPDKPVFKY
jgi:cell division septal protein FtsQ